MTDTGLDRSDPQRLAQDMMAAETVLVDFDHTLLKSNSTDLFFVTARPAWIASLALAVMRDFFPWRYFSLSKWVRARDYLTVWLIVTLAPWNLLLWRWCAPELFAGYQNTELTRLIAKRPSVRTVIVSFGFDFIIRPMLRGSPWATTPLLATPALAGRTTLLRRKAAMVRESGLCPSPETALFVTDSAEDADLLRIVGYPHLIEPRGPRVDPEYKLYFPLRYTRLAKYAPEVVSDYFIAIDLTIMSIATWPVGGFDILGLLARVALFASLVAVYEIGYFENDTRAALKEDRPTLTPQVERFRSFPLERQAWVFAVIVGLAASAGLEVPMAAAALWLGLLLVNRAVFFVYNRTDSQQRMPLYTLLQAVKYFSVPAMVPVSAYGIGFLGAQVFLMWTSYCVYRTGGKPDRLPREWHRLSAFAVLTIGLVCVLPWTETRANLASLAVMTGWCLMRVFQYRLRQRIKPLIKTMIKAALRR